MYSVDFEEIEHYQINGEWYRAGEKLADAAQSLEKAGADFIVLCTNTMHKVIVSIEEKINIPILHIADAAAKELKKFNIRKVGLLGTSYTMEEDFYISRIEESGFQVVIPSKDKRNKINEVIFSELCLGKIKVESREYFEKVIEELAENGAEGIILSCTEIGLLIKEKESSIPIFDTTTIHAMEAVNWALKK
ncbi:aspartate racemase [Marinilactibacillus piezotolerans]|uniref:Aspartate racemase n=1 Tax=Marinilactibacillus piezotolerans TaxID=258723 RepID=A0A1I3XJS0_9LACT|nr:aspartate racemase [Marinilactibacillus piezotolerans]